VLYSYRSIGTVLISLSQATEYVIGYTTECDARPTVTFPAGQHCYSSLAVTHFLSHWR